MKNLIILLIFLISSCVSKRDLESRIAELEKKHETQTYPGMQLNPEYFQQGLKIIGTDGISVRPAGPGYFEISTEGPTGNTGPRCPVGEKGKPGWDSDGIGIPDNWSWEIIDGDSVRVYDDYEIEWRQMYDELPTLEWAKIHKCMIYPCRHYLELPATMNIIKP